ncbi:hypothetical protein D3C76_1801400 [compost metagenome]
MKLAISLCLIPFEASGLVGFENLLANFGEISLDHCIRLPQRDDYVYVTDPAIFVASKRVTFIEVLMQ